MARNCLRRSSPVSLDASMGLVRKWCEYLAMKASGHGSRASAYLRLMGPQDSCNGMSIPRMFAVTLPSGLAKNRTRGGGGEGAIPQPAVHRPWPRAPLPSQLRMQCLPLFLRRSCRAPLTLGGVPIPLLREFKQLGVGQRLAAETGTGPDLHSRRDKGVAIMRHVGCLPTFSMREAALGTLANSVALYGVELADVEGRTLSLADSVAAKAIWGPCGAHSPKRSSWAS